MGTARHVGCHDALFHNNLIHLVYFIGRLPQLLRVFVKRAVKGAHSQKLLNGCEHLFLGYALRQSGLVYVMMEEVMVSLQDYKDGDQ